MTSGETLLVEIGPGLAFSFEGLPDGLERRVGMALDFYPQQSAGAVASPPISIVASSQEIGSEDLGEEILEAAPLSVTATDSALYLALPELVSWLDLETGNAGLWIGRPDRRTLDRWAWQVLPPFLIELAAFRGWLGLHAAAVSREGLGIALPGPNGVGKSTIFTAAAKAGWQVLSDDLLWIKELSDGWQMYAFPRQVIPPGVPKPTARSSGLTALVFPSIRQDPKSSLRTLSAEQTLDRLTSTAGGLTLGRAHGDRFRQLVRLAGSLPGHSLEAGSDRESTMPLLDSILA